MARLPANKVRWGTGPRAESLLRPGFTLAGHFNNSGIDVSADALTWAAANTPAGYAWTDSAYSPELERAVFVYNNGVTRIAYTDDGRNVISEGNPFDPAGWWGIAWSPELGMFAAVGDGEAEIITSPTGLPGSWTVRKGLTGVNGTRGLCVAWSSALHRFVAIAVNRETFVTVARHSDNGVDWADANIAAFDPDWSAITYGPAGFVAVGYDYDAEVGVSAKSADGLGWAFNALPLDGPSGVNYGNGKYLACGVGPAAQANLAWSVDGAGWTPLVLPAAAPSDPTRGGARDVAWNPTLGLWIAGCINGTSFAPFSVNNIAVAPDAGGPWTRVNSGPPCSYSTVTVVP